MLKVLVVAMVLGSAALGAYGQEQESTVAPPAASKSATAPEKPVGEMPNGVIAPKLIHSVDPSFSKEARKKKRGGTVEVRLTVDEQGLPQNVQVVKSVGMGLDEKAIEAVSQYRFRPATKGGVPVKVDLYIAVRFQIF